MRKFILIGLLAAALFLEFIGFGPFSPSGSLAVGVLVGTLVVLLDIREYLGRLVVDKENPVRTLNIRDLGESDYEP